MIYESTRAITTRRLILRKFTPEDTHALFELLRDGDVNKFLPMFPLKTLDEARYFLQKGYLDYYDNVPSNYRYAVCLKEDNVPVGYVLLADNASRDLGYGLKKEFWSKGIITEAANAVVSRLKSAGYDHITATHDINNPASGAVMQKLGMCYKYSYEEQWQPKDYPVIFRMYQLNFDGSDRTYREYWDKYENHFIERGRENAKTDNEAGTAARGRGPV